MSQICEALTLRTYPFSEGHKIVVFLSREQGLFRGVAYGAQKSRTRFGAALEPLTHVRVQYKQRENQDLAVLQNCEIIRARPAYELNWEETLYFSYFAEILTEFAHERVESNRLFRLIQAVLDSTDVVPVELLARYFELWVLRLEGVLPALDELFAQPLASRVARFVRKRPRELTGDLLTEEELKQLEKASGELIEYTLEKSLKSKRMLKELL